MKATRMTEGIIVTLETKDAGCGNIRYNNVRHSFGSHSGNTVPIVLECVKEKLKRAEANVDLLYTLLNGVGDRLGGTMGPSLREPLSKSTWDTL